MLTWQCVAEPRGGFRVNVHILHVIQFTGRATVQERDQQCFVLKQETTFWPPDIRM